MLEKKGTRERISLRTDTDMKLSIQYWANKKNMSINEYIMTSIENQIKFENKDYDLPTAEMQRINELSMGLVSLERSIRELSDYIVLSFSKFENLQRGTNYLAEEADKESGDI